MANDYEILLKRKVHNELKQIQGSRRKGIEQFIDYISDNPFEEGDFSETDREGRIVHCKIIRDYAITFYPDHAVREVKVIELTHTP